ncbi:hypothetical protein PAHAL_8G032900 [Panicum hallii]|uniref:Uncharacterized protein n=1 Tax=Panicum hallii TaxID=206008 RepID=A0A2S3ICP6_9POAL|nr:hypothetical protein PAHAL_8G032900 [Panicum hallii]
MSCRRRANRALTPHAGDEKLVAEAEDSALRHLNLMILSSAHAGYEIPSTSSCYYSRTDGRQLRRLHCCVWEA